MQTDKIRTFKEELKELLGDCESKLTSDITPTKNFLLLCHCQIYHFQPPKLVPMKLITLAANKNYFL